MSRRRRHEGRVPEGGPDRERTGPAPFGESEVRAAAAAGDPAPPAGRGADLTARLEALEARLEEQAQQERERVEELEDRLRRTQADFLNETKRIARRAETDRQFAIEQVVVDLLPVLDAMHSARAGMRDVSPDDPRRQGLDLVERELLHVLGRHGVRPIEAEGAVFDPSQHEALMQVDRPGSEDGRVAEVLRPGFTLHGRVVRPAHVAVVRGTSATAREESSGDGDRRAGGRVGESEGRDDRPGREDRSPDPTD